MRLQPLCLVLTLLFVAACTTDGPGTSTSTPTDTLTTGPGQSLPPGQFDPRDPAQRQLKAQEFGVKVTDRVFFDTDMSTLSAQARETLIQQAAWLKQYPALNVRIEGHADERGTREYNIALGARRASAVRDFLISQGVQASRITTTSFGRDRPEVPGANPGAWAQNRRAITAVR
jgi:peptidoglycan-associated lipoprotein